MGTIILLVHVCVLHTCHSLVVQQVVLGQEAMGTTITAALNMRGVVECFNRCGGSIPGTFVYSNVDDSCVCDACHKSTIEREAGISYTTDYPFYYNTLDATCYMLVAEDLGHAESRASCQGHGMDLAMVTSAQIQTMITTTITENSAELSSHHYWLGGERDASNPSLFKWLITDTTVPLPGDSVYHNWISGEPGSTEGCMQVKHTHGFQWNDAGCSTTAYYICQDDLP